MISIIVPVYKVESYLSRCVDSILSQSFTDYELILVDDGSPDNCGKICDEYAQKDPRVRVIHQKNGGLSAARNTGIDLVLKENVSTWITFIDSDDWVHPKYLESLYNAAVDSGVDLSVCGFIRAEELLPFANHIAVPTLFTGEECCINGLGSGIMAWGKLYKSSLFYNERYPLGKIHEDEFVTYKLLFKSKSVAIVDTPLYYYFVRQDSIMNKEWSAERLDVIWAIEEQLEFAKNNGYKEFEKHNIRRHYNVLLWNLARLKLSDDKILIQKYYKALKRDLKSSYRLFKREGFKPDYNKFDLEYGIVFPVSTKLRRYKNALVRRLKV